MNHKVDAFIEREDKWQKEFEKLRTIMLGCQLNELLKWGVPCYSWQDSNIVLMHGFKDYCAVLFFKGALLVDPEGVLVQQTKNVQSARQMRFTSVKEVSALASVLKSYIYEAIEVERAGMKVKMKKSEEYDMPEEFKVKLDKQPKLKAAFDALTPGRQKGYLLFFASAKQSKTRVSRVEKYIPEILKGKGLND